MARHRRTGSRNWARGLFATFWILLGGLSGAYLFTALTNLTALGGQLVALNTGGATPASDTTTAAIGTEPPQSSEQEIAEINERLRQLTEQVASLNARFKAAEKAPGPVAALAPSAEPVTPPATETKPPEAAASPPPPPPAEPPAEEVKPAPPEEPMPAEAPKEEPKPVEQAAVTPAEEVKPEPAPATPSEPPPVAVSPLEEDAPEEAAMPAADVPAPAPPVSTQETPAPPQPSAAEAAAPAEPAPTESAALDPIALPPAANDGSTRYGIEIGTVAKQDGLRPLWREFLTNHAALVAGLQPRRVLAPDKKWRLIAGPFGSADEASQACALFKKASRPCEATVYAGDAL
jgi:sporulation related protein